MLRALGPDAGTARKETTAASIDNVRGWANALLRVIPGGSAELAPK